MALTTAQLATLKTSIQGTSSLNAAVALQDWVTVANFYNTPGASVCWRTSLSPQDATDAIVTSEFDALTQGKRDLFALLLANGSINPSRSVTRTQFTAILSGTSLTNITAAAKRVMTAGEALFATGSGTFTLVVEGDISPGDVQKAMA